MGPGIYIVLRQIKQALLQLREGEFCDCDPLSMIWSVDINDF